MSLGSCTLQGTGSASASLASLASALLMAYQSSWCVFMCMCTSAVVHCNQGQTGVYTLHKPPRLCCAFASNDASRWKSGQEEE